LAKDKSTTVEYHKQYQFNNADNQIDGLFFQKKEKISDRFCNAHRYIEM